MREIKQPDWSEAPDWAHTWGFAEWEGDNGSWCWFAGTHPAGVHHLVNRAGEELAYHPFPPREYPY